MSGVTDAQQRDLDELGYTILPDFLPTDLLAAYREAVERQYALEGDRAGSEFKQEEQTRRLANMVDKGELFEQVIAWPDILALVAHVLGPELKLSSLNVRSANPHSDWVQPLHCDMGALPDSRGYWVCNTVWLLDDFTTENGALRAVPGTHRSGQLPQQVLADPKAPHPDEVLLTAPAGTVIVMNAHLWHGGTANRTGRPRTAMHGFYCRRDKPQQQYQKALLRPETQARLTPNVRRVLALDDPLNDELSRQVATLSGFMK